MSLDQSSALIEEEILSHQQLAQKEESWRFINLIIYIYQNLLTGSGLSVAAPFASKLNQLANISLFKIVFSTSVLVFSTMIGTIICSYYQEKIGLRNSVVFYSLIQLLAVFILRFSIYDGNYLIISQIFQGLGNSLIMNSRMRFFKNWFTDKSTKFWYPFVVTANFIGISTGFIFPFFYIDEKNQNQTIFIQQFISFVNARLFLFVINAILTILLFKNASVYAPKIFNSYDFFEFIEELKYLWKQKKFRQYTFSICIGRGNLVLLLGNFNILLKHLGIPENIGSLVLNGLIIMGLLGSVFHSQFLEKLNQPKKFLMLYNLIAIILLAFILLFILLKATILIKITFIITGFFLTNKVPFLYSLALIEIKTNNLSLLNVIMVIAAEIFIIPSNTIAGFMLEYSKGYMLLFFYIYGFYILLYFIINSIEDLQSETLLNTTKDIELSK